MTDFNEASLTELAKQISGSKTERAVSLRPTSFVISRSQEEKYIAPMRARLIRKMIRSHKFHAEVMQILNA